jgi:hypothetical protein
VEEIVDLLVRFGIIVVEAMFVIGAVGSAAVIIWVGVEDFRILLKPRDEQ